MQCSAAMDILFLMDGSYSVGKGSFERSKHFALKLCQALDIGADKVCVSVSFRTSSHLSKQFIWLRPRPGESRADSVWLHSSAGVCAGPARHQTRADEAHEEDLLQVCLSQQTRSWHSRYYHFDFHTTWAIELDKIDVLLIHLKSRELLNQWKVHTGSSWLKKTDIIESKIMK